METNLKTLIGQEVVIDTNSSWVYIGMLKKVGKFCVLLTNADVHHLKDSGTSRETYLQSSRETGVKTNRSAVYINISYIVSFSKLEDIKVFI
jgi:small nuclear ribonucleoprotein (snRNP)-like protein